MTRKLRVVYYTHPFFLEPALHFTAAMATRTEFHLVVELTPRSLGTLLATAPEGLTAGLHDGDDVLGSLMPVGAQAHWRHAASVRVLAFANARTIHPATVLTSRRGIRAIRHLRPDVFHLDDGSLRLALAAPWLPTIHVLNVHDPMPHSGDANRRIALGRRLLRRRVVRHRVHSLCFKRPFALRNGLEESTVDVGALGVYDIFREWLRKPVPRDDRTILFAGRIAPYKGLDILYAAAPGIAARVQGATIVVAGRPVDGEQLPAPPALPNGGRFVLLPGHVPNEQLAELHARATAVVCPYIDATQSGVILTAYAFNTPVVASAVGGLPEYVDHGVSGLLVPPSDPAALADAVVDILTNPALADRLGKGAAAMRDGRLNWDRIADGAMATYRAVTAPTSHSSSNDAISSR